MSANSDTPNAGTPTPPPGRVYEVLTTGEQIGDFTVESCLAYDILGSLYHVTTPEGAAKTIFVLPKILSEDESFMRRFREFKDKQVQLNHPRILGMGESRNIDGRICFVAEPSSGKSLPDYLGAAGIYPTFNNPQGIIRAQPSEAARDFTPDKVFKVAHQVLEALDFAHSQGLLHLNLTPSNMLLLDTGDIKVLGFGLYGSIGTHSTELLVSAGIPPVSLGPRNVRLNTADIISPEVHLKQEPDARADIYAFGMSMYWLLTGLKPGANYRPPSGIVPGLDPGWDIFLARCLTRERSKRYSNAKLALRDLDNLSSLGTPGYADDLAGDIAGKSGKGARPKLVRKNLVIGALAGALLATAAGGAGYWFLMSDSGDQVAQGSPVTRNTGAGTPAITVRITPAGARVGVMPGGSEFAAKSDELPLDAKPGNYTLTITAPDRVTQRVPISVVAGKTTVCNILMFKESGTLEVMSAPRATLFLEPGKGTAYLIGETDRNGKFSGKIGPGTYTLVVEKKNSVTARIPGVVVKTGEKTEATAELEGAPATLVISSRPAGAKVTLDGANVGVTPITLENQKTGRRMTLVIAKESYRPFTREITLDAGEKRVLDAGALAPATGTIAYNLRVSGREPTAAELAGITVSRSDDGLRPLHWKEALALPGQVPVGQYMIKVEHPDYEPFQSALAVSDDETTPVDINLRALPAKFEFSTTPAGLKYTLRINNREYTSPPAEIPADTPLHIEVEARDHETWTGDFTARPRRTFTLDASLRRMGPPSPGTPYTVPYLNTALAWIAPGETLLGSPADEPGHTAVEEPATFAKFTRGFWMSRDEITQEEYERVLGANPSRFRGKNRPVENVSHADATRYCKALTKREYDAGRIPAGYEYRLPNELEWEYACRAGTRTPFSFGSTATPANGNFEGAYPAPARAAPPAAPGTKAAGSYPQNAYGLRDMHGNVREWLMEPYKNHLPGGRKTDYAPGETDLRGRTYVVRGGSWNTPATEARSAFRPPAGIPPDTIADDLGFRIVLAPATLP